MLKKEERKNLKIPRLYLSWNDSKQKLCRTCSY